jgi:ribosomal protein S18 acetylase RimI-like enzyme
MAAAAIIIRRATTADLPQLLTLLKLYYTEWDIWQRDTDDKVLADLQHPDLGFFLAEPSNPSPAPKALAACVLLRPLPAITSAAECKRLYVAPAFRGHRLASLLMDAAETAARDTGLLWLYLDTKPEFDTAIALYRKRGYEEIERFNDNAQATIFMRKSLIA